MRTAEPPAAVGPGVSDLAAILVRRKWLILLVALPVVAVSVLYSYSRTPRYTANVGILVRPALTSLTVGSRVPELDAQTESNLATSVAVATVAQDLMDSTDTPQQLLKQVSANMVNDTQFLEISFSDSDPALAQQGATAFGDAYLQYRRIQAQEILERQTDAINAQLADVRSKLGGVADRLRSLPRDSVARQALLSRREVLSGSQLFLENQLVTLFSISTDPGEVIDPASSPTSPTSPRHEFDIAIGVLVGLGLGFAAALLKERSVDAIRSPIELEQKLGIPVIGSIPRMSGLGSQRTLVVAGGQRTITADAFRRLRTAVLGTVEPSDKTILVTSASGGEGKTLTVANLGAALAEIGRRVIIVSGDLRRPALQRVFPVDGPGLSEGLTHDLPAWQLVHPTHIPNLRFVPTGARSSETEPVNLLQSDHMRDLLDAWTDEADFVLIDSPPVVGVPDSLVLARVVDGVLFVADADTSRWDDVVSACEELRRAGGDLFAGVLNRVSVPRRERRAWKSRGLDARSSADRSAPARKRKGPMPVRQEL